MWSNLLLIYRNYSSEIDMHFDHIRCHNLFDNFGVHKLEEFWINGEFPLHLIVVKNNIIKENCDFPDDFNIESYEIFQGSPNFSYVDGDVIDLGNRLIHIIHTPGH